MSNKVKPVQKTVERKLVRGDMGSHKFVVSAHKNSLKVRPEPVLPLNPSLFSRMKHSYNKFMRMIEENNRKYQLGELNFMYSITWLYAYLFAAVMINAMWLANYYRVEYRKSKLRPALDERRKEFDPFDGNVSITSSTPTEAQLSIVSAKELRKDSTFSS
eukprot:TRINITY_DN5562_c0_g1_i1.p1 TRINITY_DN5562_c0_g1~~TRINITY_DN5562_c0_g1_i1.p1  ORF type:complete len:160 (+),score=21.62 TRINITY_DN5562_c0_g1_i1:62-541(+)